VLHTLPSLMRQIVGVIREQPRSGRYTRLRQVCVGGDAVPPDLLREMRAAFPQAQVTVLYGPTEATIICATHTVLAEQPVARQLIGRPLPNSALRLSDAHGQRVPVGVPGELYIGGAGVARGYHQRPELTAEKFIVIDGARWYRTGDRARYLPDGTLEFLGRIDDQVKLRGFRIELGEIEAVLAQHPAVREAVVTLRGSEDQRYLAAYLVPKENLEPGTWNRVLSGRRPAEVRGRGKGTLVPGSEGLSSTLREFLAQRLPGYMIPAAFVLLDALPVTANGKLDRRALPDPDAADRLDLADRTFTEPRTSVELVLALVWSQVLGLEQVDVHADFFDLRGHSLLAVQVIGRLKEIFPLDLPIQLLFEAPTIATLAERIVEIGAAQQYDISRIAQLFIRLDQLSDDEVARMLADQPDAE
ncbi:MAG TPA: non-ribosomal peptide synthetase, partial [Herpetosiphonaceae bacterium]